MAKLDVIEDGEQWILVRDSMLQSGNQTKEVVLKYFSVDARNSETGQTLLMMACWERNLECVQWLVEQGANVDLADNNGWRAIIYACVAGSSAIINCLIKSRVDVEFRYSMPLDEASYELSVIHTVLSNDDIAVKNRLKILHSLLAYNNKIINLRTSKNETPLYFACTSKLSAGGDNRIIELLLQHGADPNIFSSADDAAPALVLAAQRGDLNLVRLLVENNVSDRPTDLNIRTVDGSTAIFTAAQEGKADVVDYLLQKGADQHLCDYYGHGALNTAYYWSQHRDTLDGPREKREDYARTIDLLFNSFYREKIDRGFEGSYACIAKFLFADGRISYQFDPSFKREPNEGGYDIDLRDLFSTVVDASLDEIDAAISVDENPAQKAVQGVYSYLRESGFSSEQIKVMRNRSRARVTMPALTVVEKKVEVKPTWLDGLIKSEDVAPIQFGSPNCYFYFPPSVINSSGLDKTSKNRFKMASGKFCAAKGEQGVKALTVTKPVMRSVEINGVALKDVEINWELKLTSTPARFFCFKLNADAPNQRCSLIVAASYSQSGIHNGKTVESLIPQTLRLNISGHEERGNSLSPR